MDIDVKGGVNVKERFGDDALSIFILPPDLDTLARRLRGRATDSEEKIAQRLAKAEYELSFADRYDRQIVNDALPEAVSEVRNAILSFLGK